MTAFVLMATFNGARWLPAQLESLLEQSNTDWRLLVSDDGSQDGSQDIVRDYANKDPRIELLPARLGEAGAVGNFEYLLRCANSAPLTSRDFIALCDQDDIWHPEKLAWQSEQLRSSEGCCSDVALVEEDGSDSGVCLLQQLRAEERPTLGSLLAQNSVIGCTLALRPTVLDIALPFPRELCNHDWWLGLCVLAQGVLYVNREPLVRYRQHASNTVGAYRPLRQLPRLRALLERQRRVLRGQLLAVEALEKRLLARGLEPPAVLERYHRMLSGRYSSIRGLAFGPFAAPLLPLRALRTVAALTAQD